MSWQLYCKWTWGSIHTLEVPAAATATVGDLKRVFLASIRLDPEKGPAFAGGVFIAELRGLDDDIPLSMTNVSKDCVITTCPMTDALRNSGSC
jgi:hypothetical protein